MKYVKTILPITIVCLFLGLALAPAASAGEVSTEDLTLEIGYKDQQGNSFYKKLVVTEEEYDEFSSIWTGWEAFVEEARVDERMDVTELVEFETRTIELVQDIKEMTYDDETGQYLFPDIDIQEFISTYLLTKMPKYKALGGNRIFTIGRGRAWLPFNKQGESFIGMRFLPIIVQHSLGYTKVKIINLFPPSIGVSDRMFIHNLMTIGFVGLYINFGERYLDRPAGPVLLIGRTVCLRLGEDIP